MTKLNQKMKLQLGKYLMYFISVILTFLVTYIFFAFVALDWQWVILPYPETRLFYVLLSLGISSFPCIEIQSNWKGINHDQ